jgi:hypothetical protein
MAFSKNLTIMKLINFKNIFYKNLKENQQKEFVPKI